MIAAWLLYATILSALFGIAALGLDYAARAGNWPTRWIWLACLIAIVAVPVAVNELAPPPSAHPAAVGIAASLAVSGALPPVSHTNVDLPLLSLWALASLAVMSRIGFTALQLRRRRSHWDDVSLGGETVLLSSELGPAVVGLTHRRTVIPRWALDFDATSIALMLHHEREHSRAGDPYLLATAMGALVVMPWNPVLWLIVRRLRLAIEMDCDARVLSGGANPRTYASVLLAVGERMSRTPFAWAIALATPRSLLERRIVAMTSPFHPRHPRLTTAAIGAGVAFTLAVACGTEHPDPVMVSSANRTTTLASPAPRTRDSLSVTRSNGAYAKGGDTIVLELSSVHGDKFDGTYRSRGDADRRTQYLYGRPPILIRYPDGYEVVLDHADSLDKLLTDHSHDTPSAHPASMELPTRGPLLRTGERVCTKKGGGDGKAAGGNALIVSDEYCVYKGRGD